MLCCMPKVLCHTFVVTEYCNPLLLSLLLLLCCDGATVVRSAVLIRDCYCGLLRRTTKEHPFSAVISAITTLDIPGSFMFCAECNNDFSSDNATQSQIMLKSVSEKNVYFGTCF